MASTYLERTFGSTTNRRTFTYSVWVKRGVVNVEHNILSAGNFSGNPYLDARFNANGTIEWYHYTTGYQFRFTTNRVFKDSSAWYHLVFAIDTTQATEANRAKLYVNGVQETSFSNETYPSQNYDLAVNYSGYKTSFGSLRTSATFDGAMAHIHFVDGLAYTPSTFGSTDSTTNNWKPVVSPSVTYGTNGFFLKFANSGSMGTDSSGNGNNLTVGAGTLTQTQDTPTNNFARLSQVIYTPDASFSNAGLKFTGPGAHKSSWASLGFSSGKWYWEAKATSSGTHKFTIGLDNVKNSSNHAMSSGQNLIIGYTPSGGYAAGDGIGWYDTTLRKNGSTVASSLDRIVSGNIMQVACDADNGKIYFGKNGTWRVANSTTFNSANHDTTFTTGETYYPGFSAESCSWECNFGDGYFGTTAVASANADGNGFGLFEYAVPSGYYALCTKNINTYG